MFFTMPLFIISLQTIIVTMPGCAMLSVYGVIIFRIRIRVVYWWNAKMTIPQQGLAEEDESLAFTREVHLDTQSSNSTAKIMRESGW